jgi:transcriptional regulator with XRE-family HTH domain
MNQSVATRIVPLHGRSSSVGNLLRAWRRTRRVSQLDLANDCEISQRHLSFIESGRAHPSREMILRLADGLEMPLRDRNRLLVAAGYAPLFEERALSGSEMEAVRGALELMLAHHDPLPAIVVNREWDLLMANAGAARMLSVLGDLDEVWRTVCGDGPRNVFELTFHPAGMRPHITNWQDFAPPFIRRTQREAVAHNTPRLTAMLDALRRDASLPPHWLEPDWAQPPPPVLPMNTLVDGAPVSLFSMIATFGTPQDVTTDELRVEAFFPADEATRRLFERA